MTFMQIPSSDMALLPSMYTGSQPELERYPPV